MQSTDWGGGGVVKNPPINPQMLTRCLTHTHPQIETSHGKLWHCGNYAVFRKVTVSFKMHWHREKVKANRFRINFKKNSLLFGPNFLGQIAIHLYPFEVMSLSLSVSTFETFSNSQDPIHRRFYRYRFWALMDPDRGKSRQLKEHWFYLTTYVIVA